MFKELVLNDTLSAIKKAVNNKELGELTEEILNSDNIKLTSEKPKNADFGDFAVNVASLARYARIAPPMIANAIVKYLPTDNYTTSVVAGFINFKLSDKELANVIKEVLTKKENYGKPEGVNEGVKKEKINLEYVSANPTGPFHIGHGRWAAMGSSLANLLKFYGYDVYQEFYINDAGSQIQKLGRSLNIRIKQELGENIDFPEDEEERKNYYAGEYLIPVAKKFLEENKPTDDIQVLSDYAKEYMEKVQRELLENFRVHFDKFYSELDLHKSGKVDKCFNALKDKGELYEQDGAIWFKTTKYGDDQDRVLKKADGTNTYLTADIAYHMDKLDRGFDRLINIWGADHHGYVARVKASIEALGGNPDKLEILLGQLVNLIINGEEVRMGKRRKMVTLDELIEEVGVDATRFWMSMRSIDTTLDFDIELAKRSTDENPVFYVQYAHARACSILRNAIKEKINTETGETSPAPMSEEELNNTLNNFDTNSMLKAVPTAKSLILKLEEFKSMIDYSAKTRAVYTICRYVQDLASEFHSFYNSNRVICEDKDLMKSRLCLIYAVKIVLNNALSILGVSAPEKM